jgi:hypothetical protein
MTETNAEYEAADFTQVLLENARLRNFVAKVAEYSNDGWLAREALALHDGPTEPTPCARLCGVCAYRHAEWEDQPSLGDIDTAGNGKCVVCGAVGQVFDIPVHDDTAPHRG